MLSKKLVREKLIVLNTDFWVRPRDESIELQLIVESLVKTAKLVDVALKSLNINPQNFYWSLIGVESLTKPVSFGAKKFLILAYKLDLNFVIILDF